MDKVSEAGHLFIPTKSFSLVDEAKPSRRSTFSAQSIERRGTITSVQLLKALFGDPFIPMNVAQS